MNYGAHCPKCNELLAFSEPSDNELDDDDADLVICPRCMLMFDPWKEPKRRPGPSEQISIADLVPRDDNED